MTDNPPRDTTRNAPVTITVSGNGGIGSPDDVIHSLRADLAAALASIRNLETLRDVHRRTIDDLISEAQTAGATIDELRADRQAYVTTLLHERDTAEAALAAALAEVESLKNECRIDSEALLQVSRLREQGEAVRALPEMPWDRKHLDAAGGQGARGYNEALANVKAILEGE